MKRRGDGGPDPAASDALAAHYAASPDDLRVRLETALRRAGLDPRSLDVADLRALDQLHMGGHRATAGLARLAGLTPGMRVLDVGCGIGGPARTLAVEHGCRVTGVDLTQAYCAVARWLTAATGLARHVRFEHQDALAMSFSEGSFDAVWSQHAIMNIADKRRLFREYGRILGPGGRVAMHEVFAGDGRSPHYPVPWASDGSLSALAAAGDVRRWLGEAGFVERAWNDLGEQTLAWWERRLGKAPPPPGALGPALLFGDAFAQMGQNVARNLREGRIAVAATVWSLRD